MTCVIFDLLSWKFIARSWKFIARSWLNDLEDKGQDQWPLHAINPPMLVIICATYGKNLSRTVCAVEQTGHDMPYFNSFIAIGQGQRSLCATHPLMLMIICTWYGKNPSRPVGVTEQTWHAGGTERRIDRRTEWNQYTSPHPQFAYCLNNSLELSGTYALFGKSYYCCIHWLVGYFTPNHYPY